MHAARRALERAGAHVLGVRGAVSSLAPLLGYGFAQLPDLAELVSQADRLFRVVTLGASALSVLAVAKRLPEPMLQAHHSARGALRAMRAETADAFVVDAPGDDHFALGALCVWAQRFEAREGRPPTVWLSGLCADMSLSPTELLAQLPCRLARCDRLLLLASPRTPLDLRAVVALHAWRTLGGASSTVDVVLTSARLRQQTVAAFDAFHAMHASTDAEPSGGWSDGEHVGVTERLRLCAQLATTPSLNAAVRKLLPTVQSASVVNRYSEDERCLREADMMSAR